MLFITLQILKLHMVLFKLEMIQTDKKLFYTVITKKSFKMLIMTYSNDRGFISERCVISRNETSNAHNSPFNYVNPHSHSPFNYFNPYSHPFNYVNSYSHPFNYVIPNSHPFNYFNPNVVTIEKTITPSTLLPTSPRGSRWNEIFFSHRPTKHRCTRVENPWEEGVAQIFALGGQGFLDKIPGGSLFWVILHFYKQVF
jgi:hypothetical protein